MKLILDKIQQIFKEDPQKQFLYRRNMDADMNDCLYITTRSSGMAWLYRFHMDAREFVQFRWKFGIKCPVLPNNSHPTSYVRYNFDVEDSLENFKRQMGTFFNIDMSSLGGKIYIKKCDCGAVKAKTAHANWCSSKKQDQQKGCGDCGFTGQTLQMVYTGGRPHEITIWCPDCGSGERVE